MARIAIVGTAQSWQQTPFTDNTLQIWSLNDAYQMPGFQRADRWYDFHPMNRFHHPPQGQRMYAHQVPPGYYVRPKDHIAWLGRQAQAIEVFLHPDYLIQCPDAAAWPNAHAFPKAQIEAEFGRYFTSSPGWMLAHAVMDGHRDIAIYGIHLATEHEYIEQRPNFEFLIGRILGPAKITVETKDGMRHYTTQDGHVALPESSPVLQSNFQYAFEPRPRAHLEPIKWELHKLSIKHGRIVDALKRRPWWQPIGAVQEPGDDGQPVKRICSTASLQAELWQLEAQMEDSHQQIRRLSLTGV